jgi:hypothetical protein
MLKVLYQGIPGACVLIDYIRIAWEIENNKKQISGTCFRLTIPLGKACKISTLTIFPENSEVGLLNLRTFVLHDEIRT